jgi:hypothetical protein
MPIPRSRQTQGLNMLHNDTRRDFATDSRLLHTTAIAASVGLLSTGIAYLLLLLIRFFTNLFFFQTWSVEQRRETFRRVSFGRRTPDL